MSNPSSAGVPACEPVAAASAAEPQPLDSALRELPVTSSNPWLAGRVVAELEAREQARQWLARHGAAHPLNPRMALSATSALLAGLWSDLRRAFVG